MLLASAGPEAPERKVPAAQPVRDPHDDHGALAQRGQRLFTGDDALEARMVGHTETLPVEAHRCANCHSSSTTPKHADLDFAPLLSKQTLGTRLGRRGGPPSVYDAASFCRLVREGIDPAHVMISQAMPRYRLDDRECEELWAYLML